MHRHRLALGLMLLLGAGPLRAHGPLHEQIQRLTLELESHPGRRDFLIERGALYRAHELNSEAPLDWERAALLVNHAEDNSAQVGALGRRLEDGQFFIYLNGVEYRELMKCVHQAKIRRIAGALADGLNTAVREGGHDEKKQRTAALARAARFKPRIDDPQFQSWIRRLLRRLS